MRVWFEGINAGGVPVLNGQELLFPQKLSRLYDARAHVPVWFEDGELSDQKSEFVAAIADSANHGLTPNRYHLSVIEAGLAANPADIWALDILLSDAFLAQTGHRANGVVAPQSINPEWFIETDEINTTELLLDTIASSASVWSVLNGVLPVAKEYWALIEERRRIANQPETNTLQIPPGGTLRRGSKGERVHLLQQRLLGPDEYDGVFGAQLERAVIEFQQASALEADGVVGPNTLALLNTNRFDWLDRIDANLERWRWLPRETPDTYVRVNIAAFTLRAIRNGRDELNMDVIVGRPYRRTPVFNNQIRYMVVNPYWNVPTSIAVQDKLPLLRADSIELALQGYEFRSNGETDYRPVDQMDWRNVNRANFRYQLRQRPGPENALGRLKVMLPNSHAVYLHDTPTRELFSHTERLFSSGCIRLQDPDALARWLLETDNSQQLDGLTEWLESNETSTVYLKQPVPIYLVYFTAFTDESGNVIYRRDIYERDQAIVTALRAMS